MKVVLSLAAVLALAVGLSIVATNPASAWCGWRCRAAPVMVAPVVVAAPVVVVPAPAPIPVAVALPCGGGCASAYYYAPRVYYPSYVYYNSCNAGPGSCYWRRDCWYDGFGRRFCN